MFFPLILGTLFYFGFGNLMGGKDNEFAPIKVAVVTEQENATFMEVLNSISSSDDPLLDITNSDNDEAALELLKDEKVDGIIYVNSKPHLTVASNDLNPTIIQSFLNQYLAQASVIEDTIKNHPQNIQKVIDSLSEDIDYNTEVSITNADFDPYIQYFYALIAMSCMYSSLAGVYCISDMQANQSAIGMRREASPQHKLVAILSDFLATVTIQFANQLILLFYINVILNISFGSKIPFVIITCLVGCIIGTSLGVFIGAIFRKGLSIQISIVSGVSMFFSFFSGLMVENMKSIVEHACPIFNRLNPAALITDSLYSLNMYDTYTRFTNDMLIMLAMAAVLCVLSYLAVRRSRYASL